MANYTAPGINTGFLGLYRIALCADLGLRNKKGLRSVYDNGKFSVVYCKKRKTITVNASLDMVKEMQDTLGIEFIKASADDVKHHDNAIRPRAGKLGRVVTGR